MKITLLLPLILIASLQLQAEETAPKAVKEVAAVRKISAEEQANLDLQAQLKAALQEQKRGKNNKTNLKKIRAEYDAVFANPLFKTALSKKEQSDAFAYAAQLMLRTGDLQKDNDQKIASFSAGEAYAQRGIKIAPNQPMATFYDIVNSAKRAKAQGLFKSATQIGTIFKRSKALLKKYPNFYHMYNALGQFYYKTPGLLGGSDSKCVETFEKVLAMKPHFSAAKVGLAEFYAQDGEEAKAKKLFQEVLDDKKPTLYWDWLKFDKPAAARGLKKLK